MHGATARKRGRPPKFKQKGRPVTVTLPESTLARLAAIDADRSRAIVKATEAALPLAENSGKLPEIVEAAPGMGIILVGPSRCLRAIQWLKMIEVAPARYLLTIPTGTSIDSLELAVIDQMETLAEEDEWERAVLQRLRSIIATLRRGHEVSKAELLLIQKTTA
jgi:hypothetical protein